MYYSQNRFWLLLQNFRASQAIAWLETTSQYIDRKELDVVWNWGMGGSDTGQWSSLLQLLQYAHAEGLPPLEVDTMWYESTCPDTDIHLGRLFDIARTLAEVSWEKVKRVLQHYADAAEDQLFADG